MLVISLSMCMHIMFAPFNLLPYRNASGALRCGLHGVFFDISLVVYTHHGPWFWYNLVVHFPIHFIMIQD